MMNVRAIVAVAVVSLVTAGVGARALAVSAPPVSELRVEWETVLGME